jgi:AcrR family transcriptional regulator
MAYFDLPLHRKQEIEEILLELMKDTPYDRITVKSITDKMQIARKTYYHYFPNKQACLESLMDRLVTECSLRQMGLPEHDTLFPAQIGKFFHIAFPIVQAHPGPGIHGFAEVDVQDRIAAPGAFFDAERHGIAGSAGRKCHDIGGCGQFHVFSAPF